jgi:hypothetical protein
VDVRDMEQRINLLFGRVAGGVLSWFGVGLTAVFLWIAYGMLVDHRALGISTLIALSALAVVAGFCLVAGFRLYLDKPNAYGSFLTPPGWMILGCVFAAMSGFLLFAENRPDDFATLVACTAAFAAGCFYTASRLASRKARNARR